MLASIANVLFLSEDNFPGTQNAYYENQSLDFSWYWKWRFPHVFNVGCSNRPRHQFLSSSEYESCTP